MQKPGGVPKQTDMNSANFPLLIALNLVANAKWLLAYAKDQAISGNDIGLNEYS
jgi:hypothetical protein